jgi:hypothetical protein
LSLLTPFYKTFDKAVITINDTVLPFTQAEASTLFCFNSCKILNILVLGCPTKTIVPILNFVIDCHLVLNVKFEEEKSRVFSSNLPCALKKDSRPEGKLKRKKFPKRNELAIYESHRSKKGRCTLTV